MVASTREILAQLKNKDLYPVVTLNNPLDVQFTLVNTGQFASICKIEPGSPDSKTSSVYEAIGRHCVSSGHFSPSRNIYWYFTIKLMSRIASHQVVRHKAGVVINQLSGVFTTTSFEGNPIILNPVMRTALEKHEEIANTIANALAMLEEGLKDLKAAEPSLKNSELRYLMPNACATAMNIAVTPEALIHLCHERLCSKAQPEIRHIVRQMAEAVIAVDSWWKDYLVPKCVYLNGCNEKLGCGYYNALQTKKFGDIDVKPLEIRIKGVKCKHCNTVLLTKDDDPSPLSADGLCRKCKREQNERNAKGMENVD